jgi:branched-chain amino acid transport system permease protein
MLASLRAPSDWVTNYILRPVGQILLFVVGSAVLLSVIALILGLVLRTPWHGIDLLRVRENIDLFNQVVVQLPYTLIDGITIGFVYAIIALGYTMVYGVLNFVNFAHSEVFMVGGAVGYVVMFLLQQGEQLQNVPPIVLLLLIVLVSMTVCGILAVTIERLAYRPLRNAPRLVPLISAIGVSLFLQDFVRALIGVSGISRNDLNLPYPTREIPFLSQRFPLLDVLSVIIPLFAAFALLALAVGFISGRIRIESRPFMILIATFIGASAVLLVFRSTFALDRVNIDMRSIIVIVAAILMVVGLNYFVNGTRLGKAIRAVSQDQATAGLMGINVNQMIALTFLIGGALGGAAGVLFGLKTTNITPYVGFIPGLKAFTAAVLGGIGNITGALLGGILLGLLEAFFAGLLPYFPALGTGYTDIFAFAILILILIFRPAGLLGRRVDEKV